MSLLTYLGTVSLAGLSVSDTRVVTGVGFEPKALIFFGMTGDNLDDDSTTIDSPRPSWGVATATGEWSTATMIGAGSADNEAYRYSTDAACIAPLNYVSGSPVVRAVSLQSLDSDGFTLVCTAAFTAAGSTFGFIALGGDIEVSTGTFSEPSSTGSQSVTGAGLQPDLLFLAGAGNADESIEGPDYFTASWGFATEEAQAVWMYGTRRTPGSSTNRHSSYCRTGEVSGSFTSVANNDLSLTSRCDLTGFTSDGFDLNWSAVVGNEAAVYRYLAIKGATGAIGTLQLSATDTGQTAATGLDHEPALVMLLSHGFDDENGAGSPYLGGSGISTSPARWCQGAFTATAQFATSSAVHSNASEFGSQGANAFACTHVSFDGTLSGSAYKRHTRFSIESDGFTLEAQEPDNFTRFAVYLSLREAGAVVHNAPWYGGALV